MKRDYNRVEAIVMCPDNFDDCIEFIEVNCNMDELHYLDRNGFEKWYTYNDQGKVVSMTSSNGWDITWEYDEHGNQTKYIANILNGARYETIEYKNVYDNNGRLVKLYDSHYNYTRYMEYNHCGDCTYNVVKFADGTVDIDTYDYDYANNILTIQYITIDNDGFGIKKIRYNLFKYQYGIHEVIDAA